MGIIGDTLEVCWGASGSLGGLGETLWAVFGAKVRLENKFGEKNLKIEKQRFAWEG